MSKYKFNVNQFNDYKNHGGGGQQKQLLFDSIQYAKSTLRELVSSLDNLVLNSFDKYVFAAIYKDIPPKSRRFLFGIQFQNISEILQRSVAVNDGDTTTTKLYYELNETQLQWLKNVLTRAIAISSPDDFSTVDYKTIKKMFGKKKIVTLSDESNISIWSLELLSFIQDVEYSEFIGAKYFRVIPIMDIINQLVEEGILNTENYDSQLLLVFIDYSTMSEIIRRFGNIFVNLIQQSNFVVDELESNEIPNDLNIFATPNQETIGIIDSANGLSGEFDRFILKREDHRQFKSFRDESHGSAVASLIIANDEMNPSTPDGLGNFNIAHFEILEPSFLGGQSSATYPHLASKIREIVEANLDIKIWNLSLGGLKIPYSRMVSDLGKLLDILSYEKDVLFIVASGNCRVSHGKFSLNSPGDSINSLTVGSSELKDGNIKFAPYSSYGPILHYEKPEISHFGGPLNSDGTNMIYSAPFISTGMAGTSFAVPRVSRLAAHYIGEGFSPQETKAKIISLAVKEDERASAFGYVDFHIPTTEMYGTTNLLDKNPNYMDFKLIDGMNEISLACSHFVEPNPILGEEYSTHNIEIGLSWYDADKPQPERDYFALMVEKKDRYNNVYEGEKLMRFDDGKYFNSHIKIFTRRDILSKRDELLNKPGCSNNVKLAIRIKKLDLFETIDVQPIDVAFVMNIKGNYDSDDFERANSSIILAEVEVDV